jgi:hypothetical protein
MTWQVTYRLPAIEGGSELTIQLTGDWCETHGVDPGDLDSPEQAAWAVAKRLGLNGQDDAELLTIDDILLGPGGPT